MVQQVHVQVAIAIVIEEERLRRITDVLQTILLRSVGEGAVAVVDVEHVVPVHCGIVDTGNVDVDLSVPVDVGHRDAGLPPVRIGDVGAVGDVLELVVPFVAIELVWPDVRREINIQQAITIHVSDRNAASIVVIEVVDDVEVGRFRQLVGERDARE